MTKSKQNNKEYVMHPETCRNYEFLPHEQDKEKKENKNARKR
ncbi:MAG: hypothetical protein RR248_02560 [Clostridia bacterium]